MGRTIDHLRRADWLTAERVRGYSIILGIASLALLANSYVKAMGPDGTDFLAFWGAGRAALTMEPAAAYDLAVQQDIQTATGSEGWFAFVNPPPFLFLAIPFALLPFPLAWIAWVATTFSLWSWAGIRAFPRYWPLILVFPGALLAAGHAQTGLLTGALLVGGVTLVARDRPWLGGALLGALVIKPHLALLVPFWLAGGANWKAFAGALFCALGLLALSLLIFGYNAMIAYTGSWQASAALMQGDGADFYLRMATPYSQLRLAMAADLALYIQLALSAAALAVAFLAYRRMDGDWLASGALMLAATALASPYLFNYDLPFLILPTLWLVAQGRAHGFRDWEKLAVVLLFFAPYATRAAALPLEINLMPLASIVLVWLIWTRGEGVPSGHTRRQTATRGNR